jgi:imidazolonepropionase-like amidohydrolase
MLLAGNSVLCSRFAVLSFETERICVFTGFSPVEAIKIATLNGAIYLGKDKQIGSIAVGKNADLAVIKGDPSAHIEDVEKVEIVFKMELGMTQESCWSR